MSQSFDELGRYGGKLTDAAAKFAQVIEKAAKGVTADAKEVVQELGAQADKGAEWLKTTGLPALERRVELGAEIATAHLDYSKRRALADIREAQKPEELAAEKEIRFAAVQSVVAEQVLSNPDLVNFLGSQHAVISNFDITPHHLRGVSVIPRSKHLEHLKEEELPFRIYLAADGLHCRSYEKIEREAGAPGPKYRLLDDRIAKVDDVHELQLTAYDVSRVVRQVKVSEDFRKFAGATGAGAPSH